MRKSKYIILFTIIIVQISLTVSVSQTDPSRDLTSKEIYTIAMYFYLNGCTFIQKRNDCISVLRGVVLLETYQYFAESFPNLKLKSITTLLDIIDKGISGAGCLIKSNKTKKHSVILKTKNSKQRKISADIYAKIYLALTYLDHDERQEFLIMQSNNFKNSFYAWKIDYKNLTNKIMEQRMRKKIIFIDTLQYRKNIYYYQIYQMYTLSRHVITKFTEIDKKLLPGMKDIPALLED